MRGRVDEQDQTVVDYRRPHTAHTCPPWVELGRLPRVPHKDLHPVFFSLPRVGFLGAPPRGRELARSTSGEEGGINQTHKSDTTQAHQPSHHPSHMAAQILCQLGAFSNPIRPTIQRLTCRSTHPLLHSLASSGYSGSQPAPTGVESDDRTACNRASRYTAQRGPPPPAVPGRNQTTPLVTRSTSGVANCN